MSWRLCRYTLQRRYDFTCQALGLWVVFRMRRMSCFQRFRKAETINVCIEWAVGLGCLVFLLIFLLCFNSLLSSLLFSMVLCISYWPGMVLIASLPRVQWLVGSVERKSMDWMRSCSLLWRSLADGLRALSNILKRFCFSLLFMIIYYWSGRALTRRITLQTIDSAIYEYIPSN